MTEDELLSRVRADYPNAMVAGVSLTTVDGKPRIQIRTGRPGILIGKRGATLAKIKTWLDDVFGDCNLDVVEIRRTEIEPILLADHVIGNVERGVVLQSTLERATGMAVRCGARAARIAISGSLGEHLHEAFAAGIDEATFEWTDGTVGHAAVDGTTIHCEVWLALPDHKS